VGFLHLFAYCPLESAKDFRLLERGHFSQATIFGRGFLILGMLKQAPCPITILI